jgi:DNA-binding FrmR family transcriptional regulator
MQDDEEDRKKLLNRLSRVRGQVDAVSRMIESKAECVEIMMQISAATGALSKVAQLLLTDHVEKSLTNAARVSDVAQRDRMIAELVEVFERYAVTK